MSMSDQNITRRDAVKLGGATLAGVGLSAGTSAAPASTSPVSGMGHPDFRGKIVSFYTRRGGHHLLSDPQFTMLGDRLFVTGTVPVLDHWTDGLTAAVALELVASYIVFDSLEDYLTRCKEHKEKKAKDETPAT
jgi:hypothetical protein